MGLTFEMVIGRSKRNFISEKVRRLLGGVPCRVQVAALPWRKGPEGVEIMLITSRDTGRWVLPKGWPEGDEARWDAAAREALEEAGIDGAIARSAAGLYYYAKRRDTGTKNCCYVFVFLM